MESPLGTGDSWFRGLNSYESTLWAFCPFGSHRVLFKWTTHVEPQADDFRTRVRTPPPPPKHRGPPIRAALCVLVEVSGESTLFDNSAGKPNWTRFSAPAGQGQDARSQPRQFSVSEPVVNTAHSGGPLCFGGGFRGEYLVRQFGRSKRRRSRRAIAAIQHMDAL